MYDTLAQLINEKISLEFTFVLLSSFCHCLFDCEVVVAATI